MPPIIAYGAKHSFNDLKPMEINRQPPKANEVEIEILYCGICHSDVHQVKNEWKNTNYPCVPGHEIVGTVSKTGKSVTAHKVGDLVGVGCMIDSCKSCESCSQGLEQYCEKGPTATYNGNMLHPEDSKNTFGGYSETIVVREDFVLKIPKGMNPAQAAPILCAGVTTYSPLRHWKIGKGSKVGVVGLGGLGHMAVRIAQALGAEVSVITRSKDKAAVARKYGAKHVVLSEEEGSMKKFEGSFDFILSTIPQPHDINPYIALLKRDGIITVVGCIAPLSKPVDMSKMVMQRKSIGASVIGGIAETQEVLNFCKKHGIAAEVKIISADEINDAYRQVDKGEIDYRYVIDIASMKGKKPAAGLVEKIAELVD